ncbi:MAG: hypothetical protein M1489_03045 [Firmicutes bacterium]|nr:hypothetical protein [Bacillota bacterium]
MIGRPKSFREKALAHIKSISAKSRFAWLVAQNRERFGLSSAEAELLAQRADRFLVTTASGPADEQVVVDLPARDCHRRGHSTGTVTGVLSLFNHLTSCCTSGMGWRGCKTLGWSGSSRRRTSRAPTFPPAVLSLFTNRVVKSNRQRLLRLWEAGVRLPVAGQSPGRLFEPGGHRFPPGGGPAVDAGQSQSGFALAR